MSVMSARPGAWRSGRSSIRGLGRERVQWGGNVQQLRGDRVRDSRDGRWRLVIRVDEREGRVFLEDGGGMGVAECTELLSTEPVGGSRTADPSHEYAEGRPVIGRARSRVSMDAQPRQYG